MSRNAGPSLTNLSNSSRKLPNRALLYAPEKWGKTSFAAQTPKPIFLMTRGEDGLETLIDTGQLPETPHFADQAQTWPDLLSAIQELIIKDHPYKTLVIDTLNGCERLCFEHICNGSFKGDWKDFDAWGRGPNVSVNDWLELLQRLDRLREAKRMAILLLCHADVMTFKNPTGADYDRFQPSLNRKAIWPATHKWLDMILFGCFEEHIDKRERHKSDAETKGKALGGQQRLIYTERTAAFDAGNRHGLPTEIDCGDSPHTAWANFIAAIRSASPKSTDQRSHNHQPQPATTE